MEEITLIKEESLILDYKEMPAYKGAKERQERLLIENPFLSIEDNKTYEVAKSRRTALKTGRTDLQKGEKAIVAKLTDFRNLIKDETEKLIAITKYAEDKQQDEIDRFESEKQREKEEQLRKEQERKNAIITQINAFKSLKNSAIDTSTVKTIDAIIYDIQNAELQVEEFFETFKNLKEELLQKASGRKVMLVEDERLKAERKAIEAERQKLEADKKAQEESIRIQREAEEKRLRTIREEEDNRLKVQREAEENRIREERKIEQQRLAKEREEFEKQKVELQKIEAEKRQEEEREIKAKREELIKNRIKKIVDTGWNYNDVTREFTYGKLVCERWEIETIDDETFETSSLPFFKESLKNEAERIDSIKPDKQKLVEMIEMFNISDIKPSLKTKEANDLLQGFLSKYNALIQEYKGLFLEL